jgi:hypothetical protein
VPPSLWPFDVDLGDDARGRPVAVYSRCRAIGRRRSGYPGSRRGCDLYALDLAAGRERRLAALSTRDASERAPALDHGTVAFVRVPEADRRPGGARLMIGRLDAGRPARGAALLRETTIADDVLGLDLEGARLAVAVYRAPPDDPAHGSWAMLLGRRDGRGLRAVDAGGAGEEHAEVRASPTFAAGALYWIASNDEPAGPAGARVRRRDLRTGATTDRPVDGYLVSVAADARRPVAPLLVSVDDGENDPAIEWYGRTIVCAIARRGFR